MFHSSGGNKMKGMAVLYDFEYEDGYRKDADIWLIATWDGNKSVVYTDVSMSEKSLKTDLRDLSEWDIDDDEYVGHNLHSLFDGKAFDLLKATKEASAPVLQNEGKRFQLHDLARWNGVRSIPVELVTRMRKASAWFKGQHIKSARWAIEDAIMCYDLFNKVKRKGHVRFLDAKTGKRPSASVSWSIAQEDE